MSKYAILIVAAGASSRLGQPKQLLTYKSGTLLDHTIKVALDSNLGDVFVVLGSHAESINQRQHVFYLINEQWALGMGSSIAFGVKHLREADVSGLILMQCDQPYVSVNLLSGINEQVTKSRKGIVICDYGVGKGPPSFFSRKYFGALELLEGDEGAKSIVKMHQSDVEYVLFPEGKYDVDVEEDLGLLE